MKRLFFIVIPSLVFASLLFLIYQFFFNKSAGKGALQVTASPESKLYLNGKFIGQTPFPKSEGQNIFQSGDYTLRIVPNDTTFSPYEEKISITKSTLTVVDRKFGQSGTAEGSVISLLPLPNKAIQLLVLSFPEKADVYVDSNMVGSTPLLLKDLTQSDHKLKIKKDGYNEKLIPIRTPEGYKLQVVAYLGINTDMAPTPTPSSPSATPTPTGTATKKVVISQTPTGFLRVRDEASLNGSIVGQVEPGEVYTVVDEETGWYSITLKNGKTGWVSADYVEIE